MLHLSADGWKHNSVACCALWKRRPGSGHTGQWKGWYQHMQCSEYETLCIFLKKWLATWAQEVGLWAIQMPPCSEQHASGLTVPSSVVIRPTAYQFSDSYLSNNYYPYVHLHVSLVYYDKDTMKCTSITTKYFTWQDQRNTSILIFHLAWDVA